jgi:CBS domain-containing protein
LPPYTGSKRFRDVMSSPAITTGSESDVRDVALIMDEKRIKRLPVVDEQGRLIGLILRADIVPNSPFTISCSFGKQSETL